MTLQAARCKVTPKINHKPFTARYDRRLKSDDLAGLTVAQSPAKLSLPRASGGTCEQRGFDGKKRQFIMVSATGNFVSAIDHIYSN